MKVPIPLFWEWTHAVETGAGQFAAMFGSLASAVIAFLLLRRSAAPPANLMGWIALAILFGIHGLLLLLFVRARPGRIQCASCGRRRVVHRDKCEHCDAPHAPPPTDGTEVLA